MGGRIHDFSKKKKTNCINLNVKYINNFIATLQENKPLTLKVLNDPM